MDLITTEEREEEFWSLLISQDLEDLIRVKTFIRIDYELSDQDGFKIKRVLGTGLPASVSLITMWLEYWALTIEH